MVGLHKDLDKKVRSLNQSVDVSPAPCLLPPKIIKRNIQKTNQQSQATTVKSEEEVKVAGIDIILNHSHNVAYLEKSK